MRLRPLVISVRNVAMSARGLAFPVKFRPHICYILLALFVHSGLFHELVKVSLVDRRRHRRGHRHMLHLSPSSSTNAAGCTVASTRTELQVWLVKLQRAVLRLQRQLKGLGCGVPLKHMLCH